MFEYNEAIAVLKEYARDLCIEYISVKQKDYEPKKNEILLGHSIIRVLHKYKNYLNIMSKIHKLDLLDILETHKNKYLIVLTNSVLAPDDISLYNTNIEDIKNLLKDSIKHPVGEHETHAIAFRTYNITVNAQLLFAQQSHNVQAYDHMQANSIAFSIDVLDFDNQNELIERLFLVRELWAIENSGEVNSELIKYKLHYNINSFIDDKSIKDNKDALKEIINSLITKYSSLQYLTNTQLINLYKRLRNHELGANIIVTLMLKIHDEAQIRYSYNRLNESEYELINLFQNFDVLAHQEEKFRFGVVQSYLLRKDKFTEELLELISAQTDIICALALNKNDNLISILNKISGKSSLGNEKIQGTASAVKNKILHGLNTQAQKKYTNLDKFTVHHFTNKYKNLLVNIEHILDFNAYARKFLRENLIERITKDFALANLSNSIDRIRQTSLDKIKIREQLINLNLVDIFIYPSVTNMIPDLDFKDITMDPKVKTYSDYINGAIKKIISKSSSSQLEILYRPLLKSEDLLPLQKFIREEIITEVNNRSSLTKRMSAIISGKGKEYNNLALVKKLFSHKSK